MERPQPGRPANQEFYARLLNRHDELVRSGVRAPVRVIAQEMGVPYGTVKSWMKRGRDYTGTPPLRERARLTA